MGKKRDISLLTSPPVLCEAKMSDFVYWNHLALRARLTVI